MLDGGDGNDWLLLGKGDDTLIGGKGDDTFTQYESINNVINPMPGLTYSTGKDSIDGGDGIDTLNLHKAESDYLISKSGSDLVFTDKTTAGNIITVKNNVEFIAFEGINRLRSPIFGPRRPPPAMMCCTTAAAVHTTSLPKSLRPTTRLFQTGRCQLSMAWQVTTNCSVANMPTH
ncbi:hypothetical protein [Methylomonas koyamae]|uniref:hypothetical protein n=1 Tax=Methylomonas koyamae TaxID=702114 RepID=UPI00357177BC